MKKFVYIIGVAMFFALAFSSCRSQKQACGAYSHVVMPDGNEVES